MRADVSASDHTHLYLLTNDVPTHTHMPGMLAREWPPYMGGDASFPTGQ